MPGTGIVIVAWARLIDGLAAAACPHPDTTELMDGAPPRSSQRRRPFCGEIPANAHHAVSDRFSRPPISPEHPPRPPVSVRSPEAVRRSASRLQCPSAVRRVSCRGGGALESYTRARRRSTPTCPDRHWRYTAGRASRAAGRRRSRRAGPPRRWTREGRDGATPTGEEM